MRGNVTDADFRRVAEVFVWRDIVRRAGPSIPVTLLKQIAVATKDQVPAVPDPIGAVEFHIELVIALARNAVAVAQVQANGEIPVIGYTRAMPGLVHTRGVDHGRLCFTPLPAILCACGVNLLVAVDAGADPLPD